MAIWELRCGSVNEFAAIVSRDYDNIEDELFDTDGRPKDWKDRPPVGYAVDKRKKTQKPRADVSLLLPGALVLNERAREALGPFLSKFGQLMELDCEGEPRWFFNATNLVACVDKDRSEKFEDGGIMLEALDESKAPKDAAVFKDPSTAPVRIYVNDAGKRAIEKLATDAGLTGIECGAPKPL
jgi:hypothetical protein